MLGKDDRAIFSEADAAALREFDRGAQERVIHGEEIITTAGGKQVISPRPRGLRDPSGRSSASSASPGTSRSASGWRRPCALARGV